MRAPVLAAALAAAAAAAPARAEVFFDIGAHNSEVEATIAMMEERVETSDSGLHLGVGVRRDVGARSRIGARVELDEVDSNRFVAIRAVDYAFRFSERFAATAFAGAARLDLATPAYGYYFGGGMRFEGLASGWDLGLEVRLGDDVARDNLLPDDPQGGSPDNFYDVASISLYLSRGFGGR